MPNADCTVGTVFTVTEATGTGPGSLYRAVWEANEQPGVDSVVIPAGMTVIADYTIPLTESIRLCGADARTSQITLTNPAPEHRLTTPPANALTPAFDDPEWIPDYFGSLLDGSLLGDTPISASLSSLTMNGELDAEGSYFEAVFVTSSAQRDVPLVYRDLTLTDLGSLAQVRADSGSVYADGLTIEGSVPGTHSSVVDVQRLFGELALTNSTITGATTGAVTVWNAFLGENQRITIDHVNFSDSDTSSTVQNGSLVSIPGVLGRGEQAASRPGAGEPLLVVNEVDVKNIFPNPDVPAAPSPVISLWQAYGDVFVANTSISQPAQDRSAGDAPAAISLQGVAGRLAVVDSSITDMLGAAIDYHAYARWDQPDQLGLTIERSTVSRIGRLDDGWSPAITANVSTAEPLSVPAVQLTDSQFIEIASDDGPGGVELRFTSALPARMAGQAAAPAAEPAAAGVPAVAVSGSTFANNSGREANDLVANVFGDWTADAEAVTIANSTFSGTPGGEGAAEAAVSVSSGGGQLRLSEVTMHGLGVTQYGMGDDTVTMRVENSAIQTNTGLRALAVEDAAAPVATHTSVTDASGAAFGADVVTAAEMGLGGLAENGGQSYRDGSALLTHLPASDSALVDTAAPAAATASDQRGIVRPQGSAPDRGAVEVVQAQVSSVLELGQDVEVAAGKPATLTASRSGSAEGEVSATVQLTGGTAARAADGSAIPGTDYVAESFVVTWADGETADQTFTVQTLARGEAGTRTLTASLADPSGTATLGEDTSATVTIVERAPVDPQPPVTPTDPSEPATPQPPAGGTDGLATTGGESPIAWAALAAVLAAAGGAALFAGRKIGGSRSRA